MILFPQSVGVTGYSVHHHVQLGTCYFNSLFPPKIVSPLKKIFPSAGEHIQDLRHARQMPPIHSYKDALVLICPFLCFIKNGVFIENGFRLASSWQFSSVC